MKSSYRPWLWALLVLNAATVVAAALLIARPWGVAVGMGFAVTSVFGVMITPTSPGWVHLAWPAVSLGGNGVLMGEAAGAAAVVWGLGDPQIAWAAAVIFFVAIHSLLVEKTRRELGAG